MSESILEIADLEIEIAGKVILKDFNLEVAKGQVVAIVGPNGSGKSSLAMTLLGDSRYLVHEKSKIFFCDKDLLAMSVDERARAGLFVSWQNPITVPGISVFNFCKSITKWTGTMVDLKKFIEEKLVRVGLPKEYVSRALNEGFSGGERKRLELLQLLVLEPKLAVLDEIDSGLDTKGVEILMDVIEEMKVKGTSFVVITHSNKLIEKIKIEQVCKITH